MQSHRTYGSITLGSLPQLFRRFGIATHLHERASQFLARNSIVRMSHQPLLLSLNQFPILKRYVNRKFRKNLNRIFDEFRIARRTNGVNPFQRPRARVGEHRAQRKRQPQRQRVSRGVAQFHVTKSRPRRAGQITQCGRHSRRARRHEVEDPGHAVGEIGKRIIQIRRTLQRSLRRIRRSSARHRFHRAVDHGLRRFHRGTRGTQPRLRHINCHLRETSGYAHGLSLSFVRADAAAGNTQFQSRTRSSPFQAAQSPRPPKTMRSPAPATPETHCRLAF